jgi:hypothetical protein
MNKFALLTLLFAIISFKAFCSFDGDETELTTSQQQAHTQSYQQLKSEFAHLSLENRGRVPAPYATASQKDDKIMLYVAGGLVVASAALIILNNPNNYANNSASEVNTGIALGGGVAAGLFASKYFLDKKPY